MRLEIVSDIFLMKSWSNWFSLSGEFTVHV